jgi:hypothetical protein
MTMKASERITNSGPKFESGNSQGRRGHSMTLGPSVFAYERLRKTIGSAVGNFVLSFNKFVFFLLAKFSRKWVFVLKNFVVRNSCAIHVNLQCVQM